MKYVLMALMLMVGQGVAKQTPTPTATTTPKKNEVRKSNDQVTLIFTLQKSCKLIPTCTPELKKKLEAEK